MTKTDLPPAGSQSKIDQCNSCKSGRIPRIVISLQKPLQLKKTELQFWCGLELVQSSPVKKNKRVFKQKFEALVLMKCWWARISPGDPLSILYGEIFILVNLEQV